MTPSRSRLRSEVHSNRRSAQFSEPPTAASLPPSDEGVNNQSSLEAWGNLMGKKQDFSLRIVFQNVGGFSQEEEMALKLAAIHRFTVEHEVDVFGFTEANTCWDILPSSHRLARRTRGWWENSQWIVSHNRNEHQDADYQPGGTGILCVNQVAHHTLKPGDDPLGLGRWCWVRIRGPQGFFLRVVTMYRPCKSNGPLTVYQQHIRKLTSLQRYECPREAILTDLGKEITIWQDEGDHIILLSDINDDVTGIEVQPWAAKLGLVEAVTWLHTSNPPPTYQRGRRPIDGIFVASKLLHKAAGGYFGFGDAAPSNHRAIWLDLHLPEICPQEQVSHISPRARRLQCKDPRIVHKYNTILLQIIQQTQLPKKIKALNEQLLNLTDLRRSHRNELDDIDRQITEARRTAERQCRKLKCSKVQWCPQITTAINKILFWKSMLKWETGGKVGVSILFARAKKAKVD